MKVQMKVKVPVKVKIEHVDQPDDQGEDMPSSDSALCRARVQYCLNNLLKSHAFGSITRNILLFKSARSRNTPSRI